MTDFKVGDQVICMPSGAKGHIVDINLSATYPIVINWLHSPSKYEGSYTLDGFRYKNYSPEYRRFYITKDVVAPEQPTINLSSYWSIVKANSLFICLTHASLGKHIIPITSITIIKAERNSVTLNTKSITYNLGSIHFDEVANLLLTQQQSNSI